MPAIRVTADICNVTITPSDNDQSPRESYLVPHVSFDEEDVNRFVNDVYEMIDKYDLWGWCQVEVKASYASLCGAAYLGGCSYEGEEDFKKGGYFEQMADEAIAELQQNIDDTYKLIHVD